MKLGNIFMFVFMLLSTKSLFCQNTDYYWYKGEKIAIERNENVRFVMFSDSQDLLLLLKNLEGKAQILSSGADNSAMTLVDQAKEASLKYFAFVSAKETIVTQDKYPSLRYQSHGFWGADREPIGMSNYFYVKLKSIEGLSDLKELTNKYSLGILGRNKFMPLWYTIDCAAIGGSSALDYANLFYESSLFEAAEPDFVSFEPPNCLNDTRFAEQWSHDVIGTCQAWGITNGNPDITVAVLDQGIERGHVDLVANISPISFNTESGTSPSLVFANHGSHVGGIIAATGDNQMGIAGVAPDCQLMSISNSLAGTPNSRQRRADGINFAVNNGADVINNSWRAGSQRIQLMDDAITNALTSGRNNNLGMVVVFSSGNSSGAVEYPANSNDGIITVGNIQENLARNPTSCFGNELDVVAPGTNILSTVQGNAYAFDTGTSMAAPQVAGVAALLLSLNPCLSQRQVADIIMRSATKLPGFNFNINRPPNGTWNNEVGHGLVDAFDALRLVQTMIIQDQIIAPTLPVNTGQLFANPIGDVWAGRNVDVTGSYAVNDVAVTQGANVTFQSSQRIRLANGFRVLANTGNPTAPTRFRATIQPNFNGGCNGWISTRTAPEPPSQQAEPVSDFAVKKFSSSDGYALSLYPNPNNGRFSLSYQRANEERKEGIAIQVSNVLGQMVFLQNLDANANTDGLEIQLDQAKLKTGIYFLQLREGNQCSNLKFIVHEN